MQNTWEPESAVAPLWERGLKRRKNGSFIKPCSRSLMGAWIETYIERNAPELTARRSLMGAWIETAVAAALTFSRSPSLPYGSVD